MSSAKRSFPAYSAAFTPLERAPVMSLNVSLGPYVQIKESIIAAAHRGESRTACFVNVHMAIEGKKDPAFTRIVNEADWVVTDGIPITWALRRHLGIEQERVAGIDMLPDLVSQAAEQQLPIFFYGSTPEVLATLVTVCRKRYPTVQIAGTLSPPFRPLSGEEEEQIVEQINQSGARLVFVALGCPKQERWMAGMRGRVQAVMVAIGGALPILAGMQSRSPRWMQRGGLEWVYRLAMEPRRLFKRYAVTNSLFVLYLVQSARKPPKHESRPSR